MTYARKIVALLLLICLVSGGILYWMHVPLPQQRVVTHGTSQRVHSLALIHAPCVAPPANAPHELTHCPTVTAAFLDHVLALAHSPAMGLGTVLYEEGKQYGIDPAYALAFWHHESSYGLSGVARVTLSLGNIRCTPGYRCIEGYRAYASYADGIIDWYRLIATVYLAQGLVTVEQIIPVYAPAADHNNEAAYIASVNQDVSLWRKGQV